MHRVWYLLFATLVFFAFGVPIAFGNIQTPPGAPTDPQPFSFFCNPYTFGFESGNHYIATEGGFCTFAIPLAGQVFVSVYKGTVGSSEIVLSEFHGGPARVVQTFPNHFENPPNEQDLFGVVYAASLGSAFNEFLRTGAPLPAGAVEGVNYFILPWKWGPKPTSEFDPVVIIPGILGSWQKDSNWIIDPVLHTYDNLIDTFEANGYVLGQNLFPFGYDWHVSNVLSGFALKEKIEDIRSICDCSHVDVVGHSMGGLVAWQYLESNHYQNDIDQLIFLATPLMGAPKAYLTWEGGEVDLGSPFYNVFGRHVLKNEARAAGFSSIFDYIRNGPVSSVQELLPVYSYLFNIGFYPTNYPQNLFLENLHAAVSNNGFRGVRITNILADNFKDDTIVGFFVSPSTELPKWEHGKPTFMFRSSGDGTVPRESIENYLGFDKEFSEVEHNEVASTSAAYIFETLNKRSPDVIVGKFYSPIFDVDWSVLWFKILSPIDVQITAPDGKRLGKDFDTGEEFNEIPDAFYSGFNTDDEYALIINPLPGTYTVETEGTGSGAYTIVASYIDEVGDVETEVSGSTNPAQAITHTLQLSLDTRSISIEAELPTDTEPPDIIITSPEGGRTYTRLDTVSIVASITDESEIASTTYQLNGTPVDPAVPLPFITTPLGTSTVSVSATDSFGNIGEASTTFMLGASPESCTADMARAFQNKWIKKKGVYNNLVEKCQKLKKLFEKNKKKTDKHIEKVLKDMEKLANGKHVTLEGRALILENVTWFRDHIPKK